MFWMLITPKRRYEYGLYLKSLEDLTGKDDLESAFCDTYVDGMIDMDRPNLVPVYAARFKEGKEAVSVQNFNAITVFTVIHFQQEAAWTKFKQETLKSFLDRYEAFVVKNGNGVLVGDQAR